MERNCPGNTNCEPKTAAEGEKSEPSLQAVRIPIMTQGRCTNQSALAALARRASFIRRWNRSTRPFDWGWYAVVCVCLMERRDQRAAQSEEVNCGPLLLVMMPGMPNRCIHPCRRAASQSAAVVEASGTASGQRVVLSTMVNMYEYPEERGSGPTRSTWRCAKRRTGTGMCAAWRVTWRCTFAFWQCRQLRVKADTNKPIFGQQKLAQTSLLVALTPG